MAEIRKDPFSGARVIYSPSRENRPDFTGVKRSIELSPENCPFCSGNEEMTPPEIYRVGDSTSWRVRVIPNKFPVLEVEENRKNENVGIFRKFRDAGAHEVIIETPHHIQDLSQSDAKYFRDIFYVYRERIRDLKKDIRLKYVQIFKNFEAAAGATISHHHSQLIALPFVPANISERLRFLDDHYLKNRKSLFSDVVSGELELNERIVSENGLFIAFTPWYSRSPFQISIFNKKGYPGYEDIDDTEIVELSNIFAIVIKKLVTALGDPPMNIILNTAPFDYKTDHAFSWNIDVLPALVGTGGFETATGTYINSVLPEKAAAILKKY